MSLYKTTQDTLENVAIDNMKHMKQGWFKSSF